MGILQKSFLTRLEKILHSFEISYISAIGLESVNNTMTGLYFYVQYLKLYELKINIQLDVFR